jgi:hypothetical protein
LAQWIAAWNVFFRHGKVAVLLVVGVGLSQAFLEGLLGLETVATQPLDHVWRRLLAVSGRSLGEEVAEGAGPVR